MSIGCNSQQATSQTKEDNTLKVGVLPIVDVLPIYVADKEGLFKDIKVEIVPFRSAIERDTAMQTGQLDVEVNDLVSAALLNKDGDRVRVTRYAMRATADNPMFVVLGAPNSGLTSLPALGNGEVAISNNTIIEYVTDTIFKKQGGPSQVANKTEVAVMPVRLEMLQKGQVKAATLPEPLASAAAADGAKVLAHDGKDEIGSSTVSISTKTLQTKPNTVKKFLEQYELAVKAINANPESYRDLMVQVGNVPAPVSKTYKFPPFPKASAPTEAEATAIVNWMVTKGLLAQAPAYNKLVDGSFLPQAK